MTVGEHQRAVAIVSGGMDSVTLAYLLDSEGYDLHLLSIDYAQRHKKEISYAKRCAERLGAAFDIADIAKVGRLLSGSALTDDIEVPHGHYAAENMAATVVPNRNAVMLSIAYGVAVAQKAVIEAREVLDELEVGRNLITMDWQDFEMLVRDVFERVFSEEGTEVNVTRASRDEGVDAVVINPDPFKGGKTIVQAKRYRKAVPVAAVRELYGAMQNERAGKGILVTTANYGRSAHEFARDKEITLIDGAGLLHLLQNHGHRVRIDPSEV